MHTKRLGKSDLDITPIGCGCWAMGGADWAFGWGNQDDKASIEAIHAAVDAGINWIDTAPVYGLGHSEEVVGKAIKELGSRKPYVFTKCAHPWAEDGELLHVLKADSLRQELEASLKRLGVEAIDLYQVHWPNPVEDIEEGLSALAQFKKEGKIREIGVSNFNVDELIRAQAVAPITTVQPNYSVIARDVEFDVLPYALEQEIGVIVYSPMHRGLLSGKMTRERVQALPKDDHRRENDEFKEPNLGRNLQIADKLKEIGARHGRSAGEAAVAWTLGNPAVTGAIVGFRNAEQVKGMQGALEFRLSAEETKELQQSIPQEIGAT